MISIFISIILSLIFIILSLIHFNWVLGGTWGFDNSLPTNEQGERVLHPKKYDSAIVGLGLASFGIFYLLKSQIIEFPIYTWITTYGGWIIPSVFLLRALGEFKYLGFFKKIQNTEFGKMDTKFYSPLCLLLGILGIIAEILQN
jgi:hypothetical protein